MQQKFFVRLVLKQRESKSNRHAPVGPLLHFIPERHALVFKANTGSIADGEPRRAFIDAGYDPHFVFA